MSERLMNELYSVFASKPYLYIVLLLLTIAFAFYFIYARFFAGRALLTRHLAAFFLALGLELLFLYWYVHVIDLGSRGLAIAGKFPDSGYIRHWEQPGWFWTAFSTDLCGMGVLSAVLFRFLTDAIMDIVKDIGFLLRGLRGHAKGKAARSNVLLYVLMAALVAMPLVHVSNVLREESVAQTQVRSVIVFSANAEKAIDTFRRSHGSFPFDNDDAGLASPDEISNENVDRLEVKDGSIFVTLGSGSSIPIRGGHLVLFPLVRDKGTVWNCVSMDVDYRYLRGMCLGGTTSGKANNGGSH